MSGTPAPIPTPPRASRWLARLGSLGGRTVFLLVLLALLIAAADRVSWLADWSSDHRFSLSPSLVRLLRAQNQTMELIGIWPEELNEAAQPIADGLRLMAAENPRLAYRHIDPVLHKPLLVDFAKRYHEAFAADTPPPTIYVTRSAPGSERAFKIPLGPNTRRVLQREVGGALVALADPHPPLVSFLQGHRELRPDGGPEDGADELVRALQLAGLRVEPLELARTGRIAAESVLVIAGALSPLGGHDLAAVEQHLADGGAALILADDRTPLDLAEALRKRSVLVGPAFPLHPPGADWLDFLKPGIEDQPARIIASMHHHFIGQESAFPHHNLLLDGALVNPRHPATTQVAGAGQGLLSPWTSYVQVLDPAFVSEEARKPLIAAYQELGTPAFSAEKLLQTADDTWLKRREDPLQAPNRFQSFPFAWAVSYRTAADSVSGDRGARLVVWGSRQAASDGVLAQGSFANATLLVDVVRWLARRTAVSDIPEAESAAFRVEISDRHLSWLIAALIIMPCLFIGVAILAWWERR